MLKRLSNFGDILKVYNKMVCIRNMIFVILLFLVLPYKVSADGIKSSNFGVITDSNLAGRDINIRNNNYTMAKTQSSIDPAIYNMWIYKFQRGDIEYTEMLSGLYGSKLLLQAKKYILENNIDKAESVILKYFKDQLFYSDDNKKLARIYYCLGVINQMKGDYYKSKVMFKEANNRDPSVTAYSLSIADICIIEGQYLSAINIVNEVLSGYLANNAAYSTKVADCYVSLGSTYYLMHDTKRSIEYLDKAIHIYELLNAIGDNQKNIALYTLGLIYLYSDPTLAKIYFNKALSSNNKINQMFSIDILASIVNVDIVNNDIKSATKNITIIKSTISKLLSKKETRNVLYLKFISYRMEVLLDSIQPDAGINFNTLNKYISYLEMFQSPNRPNPYYYHLYVGIAHKVMNIDHEMVNNMITKAGFIISGAKPNKETFDMYYDFSQLLFHAGDVLTSIRYLKICLDNVDKENKSIYLTLQMRLVICLYMTGQFESARTLLSQVLEESNPELFMNKKCLHALHDLIMIYSMEGSINKIDLLISRIEDKEWANGALAHAKEEKMKLCETSVEEICNGYTSNNIINRNGEGASEKTIWKIDFTHVLDSQIRDLLKKLKKYLELGHSNKANTQLKLIKKKLKVKDDVTITHIVLLSIADVFSETKDIPKALEYYDLAINSGKKIIVLNAYFNAINMLVSDNNIQLAVTYTEKAANYLSNCDEDIMLFWLYIKLGDISKELNLLNTALSLYLQAERSLSTSMGTDSVFKIVLAERIGDTYSELANPISTHYYNEGIDIISKSQSTKKRILAVYYEKLGDFYSKVNDPKASISYKHAMEICELYKNCDVGRLKLKINGP